MDKASVIRVIIFVVAWFNTFAASKGWYSLPDVNEEQLSIFISFVVSIYTMYKNQYLARKGRAQAVILDKHDLK